MERAELRDVVQAIAAVSGANIVVGSDVAEGLQVSVRLRNIPWFQALNVVVKSVGMTLIKEPDTEIYMVRDPDKLKKVLDTVVIKLKYIRPEEGYGATLKNAKVVVPSTQAKDTKKRIEDFTLLKAVQKGMTPGSTAGQTLGSIDYDITTNSFILSDVASKIEEIRNIIEELDREPLQVQVDVKFVSTTVTDFLDVGINFTNGVRVSGNLGSMTHRLPFELGNGGLEDEIGLSTQGTGPTATGFQRGPTAADVGAFNATTPPYNFGVLDFRQMEMATQFLKTDGRSQIVQRPSLTVLDNFAATIFVGEVVRYAEVQLNANQQGGLTGTIAEAGNSPVSTGFQLIVVPHVVPGTRKIQLTLVPTLDTLTGRSATNPGFDTFTVGTDTIDLPRLASATIVTQMLLEDGETAVLGGLIDETENETINKLPLLGDIPILGYLFKNVRTNRIQRNVILFVTVRIVRTKKEGREALEAQLKARDRALRKEYYEQVRRTEWVEPEAPKEGEGAAEKPADGGQGGNFYAGASPRRPVRLQPGWDRAR
jgi:type IV pilus assembly protein PilQ